MDQETTLRSAASRGARGARGAVSRLSVRPATLIAYLALTVAMSGAAYAAGTIGSADIIDNSIRSVDLKDGAAVSGVDVVDDSLTGADVNERTLSGVARKINRQVEAAVTGAPKISLITLGGYTVKATCWIAVSHLVSDVFVDGAGAAEMTLTYSFNDDGTDGVIGHGVLLTPGTDVAIVESNTGIGFERIALTAWLHAPAGTIVNLNLHELIDSRAEPLTCYFWGSATKPI
jgi:hypothetical protein